MKEHGQRVSKEKVDSLRTWGEVRTPNRVREVPNIDVVSELPCTMASLGIGGGNWIEMLLRLTVFHMFCGLIQRGAHMLCACPLSPTETDHALVVQ